MDVALANPELIIVTRDGRPLRVLRMAHRLRSCRRHPFGGRRVAGSAAREATNAVAPVRERRKGADATAIDARSAMLNRATLARRPWPSPSDWNGEDRRLERVDRRSTQPRARETLSDDLARTDRADRHGQRRGVTVQPGARVAERSKRPSRSLGNVKRASLEARQGLEGTAHTRQRGGDCAVATRGRVLRAASTLRAASR
jgi:hypothetical protein